MLDAASELWQFAANHAWDHLRGNHLPALVDWAHFLLYLRSICGWELSICLDGMENEHKQPEIERRKMAAENARQNENLIGQIKNTPDYIRKAKCVCEQLGIECQVSAYEADPQVSYVSVSKSAIAITGDSDLLAYGVGQEKLIIVKGFKHEWFRVIDLNANVPEGDYPLFDMYNKHGRIVFQLYAACSGCDFTDSRSGISGIGYESFVEIASKVEGELSAATLSNELWDCEEGKMRRTGFETRHDVQCHLQKIVDVYQHGQVYDEHSNIIDMNSGDIIQPATDKSRQHMAGQLNSRTQEEFSQCIREEINKIKCCELLRQTAADVSTIRGVNLPEGKEAHECNVSVLRDFVAARGGKITMTTRPNLISTLHS